MLDLHSNLKKDLESTIAYLSSDLVLLHSARATPALVENILVSAYGGKMPLKELASLATPDARTIIVQPWDTSTLPEIQNALLASHLGLGLAAEEKFLRLTMPLLSTERRKEIVKHIGKRTEEARISVRKLRDIAMKTIEDLEKKKEISQDEKFRQKEGVQKLVDEYNKKMLDIEQRKIQEIENA